MGFKSGAICTVFEVTPKTEKITRMRVAVSRKVPGTDPPEYKQDFGGYISVIGEQAAKQAAKLKAKDRITLGDVDVSVVYDKDKGREYTDFKVFGFTKLDNNGTKKQTNGQNPSTDDPQTEEGDYPF